MSKTASVLALAALLALGALSLTACKQEPSALDWTTPEGAVVSVKAADKPKLDGVADEAAWKNAPETVVTVVDGANKSATQVKFKSVHTADMVYFVASWADPTQSFLRSPWEKQANGSWKQLADPADKGGDNNLWYEDKFAMIWSIKNSIPAFGKRGCAIACHPGENPDIKPYGNKYTATADELGDIWHWKSVRNLNQIDDQYLDSTRLDPANLEKTEGAGRHSDPDTGGGYADNKNADGSRPAFMLPANAKKDGSPGFILDSKKLPFDDSKFVAGNRVPSIVIAEITGDRGDISAGWKWANGTWTLEFGRKLKTGSPLDVQFSSLNTTYYFGPAVFDNAQVRHAYKEGGATPFVFKP